MKKFVCSYDGCRLPKNNRKYMLQMIFVVFSLFLLYGKPELFNFFNILIFISPIFIDLAYNDIASKLGLALRVALIATNLFIVVACLLGLFGIIGETSTGGFILTKDFLFEEFKVEVSKRIVGIVLAADILVPIMYWIGSPTSTKNALLSREKKVKQEV